MERKLSVVRITIFAIINHAALEKEGDEAYGKTHRSKRHRTK